MNGSWCLAEKMFLNRKNGFDCGVFICMFGYFISHDRSLLFDQADVTHFRKQMALAIMNLVSIWDEDSEVNADSVGAAPSSLNDKQEEETVLVSNVPQGSPHHDILLSTNDGGYVAKLHDKLPQNVMNYLKEYVNNCFEGNVEAGVERQFNYFQTSSDENAKLEMNVFILAKGLLERLNQGTDPRHKFAPYKAKWIYSRKKK
jgi:hypothetical protein